MYINVRSEISGVLTHFNATQLTVLLCKRNSYSFQDYTPNKKATVSLESLSISACLQ